MARERIIQPEELERLASLQCTQAEIAAYFKVTSKAVEKALKKPEFRDAYERGVNTGLISLRRAQFKAALGGNPTMLIWMGKQCLGQRDSQQFEADVNITDTSGAKSRIAEKLIAVLTAGSYQQSDPGDAD